MAESERVVVIGLDGANREVLLKGINNGSLPNMAGIVSEGDIATLKAPLPPTTPVSMSSILTGVYPDRHGIFSFEKMDGYVGYGDIETPTVFDILHEEDMKAVSVNTPMTSPPPEIEVYIVGGFPSKGPIAWPPTLADSLRKKDYRVENPEFRDEDDFFEQIMDLAEERFHAARSLLDREWDVFMLTFTGDARLQHYMDDEQKVMEFYQRVDSYIGEILEDAGEDTRVMVISDHGFNDLETEFDIAAWLEKEGYMASSPETDWGRLYGEIEPEDYEGKAVPGGAYMGNIHADPGVREEIVEKLESLEHKGEKVFRDVFLSEELYGENDGPDIIPVPRRGFNYVAGNGELFDGGPEEKRAPDREGVVITDFDIQGEPESVDVLPTLLDILGVEERDLDGTSLFPRE